MLFIPAATLFIPEKMAFSIIEAGYRGLVVMVSGYNQKDQAA